MKILSILLSFLFVTSAFALTESEIKLKARQSSVQPSFFIPVVKAYFSEIEESKEPTLDDMKKELTELFEKKLEETIRKTKEELTEEKYLSSLTTFEQYGVQSKSYTEIALGTLVPKWAKFPQKVLVVCKTEKKTINTWEEEYKEDVHTISETTGISLSKAKKMLDKLIVEGYSITKDKVDENAEVVLLHFSSWDDSYPTTLRWKVSIDDGPNLIRGYDPRGILIVKSIPQDNDGNAKRVYVKAGYFDLKEKFKPKTPLEERLLKEKAELEEKLKKLEKEEPKEEYVRDITEATMYDVLYGNVILERFFVRSGASGVYLGNMKVAKEMTGYEFDNYHTIASEYKSIVLTNSHVAAMLYNTHIYVSEDKQTMWIVLPAYGFIRYTQDSDTFGSPATLLVIDGMPVDSYDNDCALLMTSTIPGFEKYAAKLGDSDKVREGLEVVAVGSPSLMQKQLTKGIVSNTSYNILKSPLADGWLANGMSRREYEWAIASSLWCDFPIGVGGVSGSPIFALSGSEAGKVIALRNMGLVSRNAFTKPTTTPYRYFTHKLGNGPLRVLIPENRDLIFKDFNYKTAVYTNNSKALTGKDTKLEVILDCGCTQDISGMNGAVPINKIKQFLTERGIDIQKFGSKRLPGSYWLR